MPPRRSSRPPPPETSEPPPEPRLAPHVAAAQLGAPPAPPTLLEYRPLTAPGLWRVARFDLLAGDLSLPDFRPETMAAAHALWQRETHLWHILRRLYGIMPVIPDAGAHPDEMRVWPADELCEALRMDPPDLALELEAARVALREEGETAISDSPSRPLAVSSPPPAGDDDLLEQFGFGHELFEAEVYDKDTKTWQPRSDALNRAEQVWFAQRVRACRKMLAEPMTAILARNMVITELHMRRIELEAARLTPGSPRFAEVHKTRTELERNYQENLQRLNEIFPWSDAIGGKATFMGVLSDLVRGIHDYEAHGDNALIDKIYTQAEIEILCRTSQQIPVPRYRIGQVSFLLEAMHGLHDPNYRTLFKNSVLRAMDAAGQAAILAMRGDEKVVDLESSDPAEEFEDLKTNTP